MHQYDYLIIGGGLAGLQLASGMLDDAYFSNKKIGIIEPTSKELNDKTWCYWENYKGKWDFLTHHSWNNAEVITSQSAISLDIGSYQYKMIRAVDFYNYVLDKLKNAQNIDLIPDEIVQISNNHCKGKAASYQASYVFDSRISKDYFSDEMHIHLKQHFKGWLIESSKDCFDPSKFTMMDFTITYQDHCFFTYVLPISERIALIEATFFTKELVDGSVYNKLLKEYIEQKLSIEEYSIKETEEGVIPMSTYPFHNQNTPNYIKIGTAGGWVKASSGYSFKSTEKKVVQLIDNIKNEKALDHKLFKKRYRFYDRIFLRILHDENYLGNQLFKEMYQKNNGSTIFRFLDEETTLKEEIRITNSFKKAPFLRSLQKEIR